jgi:transcriptional regulator with XRE-family HTH domain
LKSGLELRYSFTQMKTLGEQIKTARLQRHLSQSALARKVGCKQSALSMFESGRATALGAQTIGKLCDELGLLPPSQAEIAALTQNETVTITGERTFCPNPQCPSNLPIDIGGNVALVPRGHLAQSHECHCAWCGEVLERACPECGAPVNAGAFCTCCGKSYLVEAPATIDPRRVAQSERLNDWITA